MRPEIDIHKARLDAFTPPRPHQDPRLRALRHKTIAQSYVDETIEDIKRGLRIFAWIGGVLLAIHYWPQIRHAAHLFYLLGTAVAS